MTQPDMIRLVDLVPRWTAETGLEVPYIAGELMRLFKPVDEWVAEAEAAAARAAKVKDAAVTGTSPLTTEAEWGVEAEARSAARAKAQAEAAAAKPTLAEPTLDEVWVAEKRFGPEPKRDTVRVRLVDLYTYFKSDAVLQRPPGSLMLGTTEPFVLYDAALVWLSVDWLRRVLTEGRLPVPPFLAGTPAEAGRPPHEATPHLPRVPRNADSFAEAAEIVMKEIAQERGRPVGPDEWNEVWDRLRTNPPPGFGIKVTTLDDEEALTLGNPEKPRRNRETISKRNFKRRFKNWTRP